MKALNFVLKTIYWSWAIFLLVSGSFILAAMWVISGAVLGKTVLKDVEAVLRRRVK